MFKGEIKVWSFLSALLHSTIYKRETSGDISLPNKDPSVAQDSVDRGNIVVGERKKKRLNIPPMLNKKILLPDYKGIMQETIRESCKNSEL